ncbi:VOC family protein [Niallia sp.]|uniref:VOC family protein n=1 Tax=Niallia sp. TaxID=2837523 RepID=UPI002897D014|nr:VOC family protein [Niallia sp.]
MTIIGVHHVQITIPKGLEQQAKEFYCEVLGLTEIEKPVSLQGRGGFWLSLGNLDIHVGTEDGFDRNSTKAHLAYQVESMSNWKNKLSKLGVKIADSIPIEGFERFEFRDPFGNRVEIIEKKIQG